MKSLLYPAEVLKGQQLGKIMVQVIEYHIHAISPTFKKLSVQALNTQTTGPLNALFYNGSAQQ